MNTGVFKLSCVSGLALEFLAGLEGRDVFTVYSGHTHWVESLGLGHRKHSQGLVSAYFKASSP